MSTADLWDGWNFYRNFSGDEAHHQGGFAGESDFTARITARWVREGRIPGVAPVLEKESFG